MNSKTVPDTIRTIIAQAGGHSLRGALLYVDAYDSLWATAATNALEHAADIAKVQE